MLTIKAGAVDRSPYSFNNRIDVVSTAGPVIKGTPIGTAPRLSGSTKRLLFSTLTISLIDMTNRSTPPAIMKSKTVIPRSFRIPIPMARNKSATTATNIGTKQSQNSFIELDGHPITLPDVFQIYQVCTKGSWIHPTHGSRERNCL